MNPNEKITHKVSAEAAGQFERWMTEAEERWRKGVLIISEENIDLLDVDTLAGYQLDIGFKRIFENKKDLLSSDFRRNDVFSFRDRKDRETAIYKYNGFKGW